MHAEFPIHQQGQLAIMSPEAVEADVIRGSDPYQSTADLHFG